jgi:hypothetical protein
MAYSETLKMEAILPSEMSANLYQKIVLLEMNTVFWDMKVCSYVERYQLSGKYAALLFMVFYTEIRSSRFLRNVDRFYLNAWYDISKNNIFRY